MAAARIAGFRLGIYVFKDVEIVDFAAPYGVFSVARRYDPELDAFFIADAIRPVQAQAGFTVLPNYSFNDRPAMNAFLIPGGFGTRQEVNNGRLHEFIRSLPESCLLTSVCTGSWIYGKMGLLDGLAATNRKEPDRGEANPPGRVPIDRLADIAPSAASAARASSMPDALSPPAALPPGWKWGSTCFAAPDTTSTSPLKWHE
jgi:putative intracellular protease/amidase